MDSNNIEEAKSSEYLDETVPLEVNRKNELNSGFNFTNHIELIENISSIGKDSLFGKKQL